MAPQKLTEADKVAILGLYRQPEETTSTLAERYGVSNSTISRLLKASLPEAEYKKLIQQKRGSVERDLGFSEVATSPDSPDAAPPASPDVAAPVAEGSPSQPDVTKAPPILKKRVVTPKSKPASETAGESPSQPEAPIAQENPSEASAEPQSGQGSSRRRRSRSRQDDIPPAEATQLALSTDDLSEDRIEPSPEPIRSSPPGPIKPMSKKAAAVAKADDPSDHEDWEDTATALDDDYGEEDDDDEEDDAWDGDTSDMAPHLEAVEINPLTPSDIPSQCYLVVERVSSELVVLPLKTFASLGQIPEEEGDHRTLPVFDNHRVARRFSRRNQRVIKVPDGSLLQTTRPYLQAKGITRLLIDGHVFALEDKREEIAEVTH